MLRKTDLYVRPAGFTCRKREHKAGHRALLSLIIRGEDRSSIRKVFNPPFIGHLLNVLLESKLNKPLLFHHFPQRA